MDVGVPSTSQMPDALRRYAVVLRFSVGPPCQVSVTWSGSAWTDRSDIRVEVSDPGPLLSKTVTVLDPDSVTTRSCRLSPFRSPIAMHVGAFPAPYSVL